MIPEPAHIAESFAERAIAARMALAEDDPEGEFEALHPLASTEAGTFAVPELRVVDDDVPDDDGDPEQRDVERGEAWQAGLEESVRRAGFDSVGGYEAALDEQALDEQARTFETVSGSRETTPQETVRIQFRSARELAAETPPAIAWIAKPWIARGTLIELVGRAKAAGKSTFLGHLMRAIVDGRPFLGGDTAGGPVVFLSEQPATTLREVLARADLLERDDIRIVTWRDVRGIAWPDVVAGAVAECRTTGAGLLIVDTLPAFAGIRGDAENDAGAALQAIAPLQAAAADGLAVLVVRHERKGSGEVGESGRGSSAFTGAVDVVLRLARQEQPARPGIRILSALSRFDETPAELAIELVDTGYVALGTQAAVALTEARDAVLDSIDASADGLTLDELTEELGPSHRMSIRTAIGDLLAAGSIVRTGRGKRGDPYRHVRSTLFPVGDLPYGESPDPTQRKAAPPPATSAAAAQLPAAGGAGA